MINNKTTSPPRMLLEKAQSDRSIDSFVLTPSRLCSSKNGKKTLNHRLGSISDGSILFSKSDSLLMSPEGMKGIVEISEQLKDLIETLPSREKGDDPLMAGTGPTRANKSLSRRNQVWKSQSAGSLRSFGSHDLIPTVPSRVISPEGDKKDVIKMSNQVQDLLWKLPSRSEKQNGISSPKPNNLDQTPEINKFGGLRRMKSSKSLDFIPSLPSRTFSPAKGKEGIFEISGQARDLLVETFPSPLDNKEETNSNLWTAVRVPQSPLYTTTNNNKSSSSSVASTDIVGESKVDADEDLLAKMPDHVKNLLSTEQWYRVLEPASAIKGHRGNHSVCSDITTDDDWSEQGPAEQEERQWKETQNADEEDEDIPGGSAWGAPTEQGERLSTVLGNEEEEDVSGSARKQSAGMADDVVHPSSHQSTALQDTSERNETSWIEANSTMAHDGLYCTEGGESKTSTVNEQVDPHAFLPFTSSTILVTSKAHDTVYENSKEEMKEEATSGDKHDSSSLTEESVVPQQGSETIIAADTKTEQVHVSFVETAHVRWYERILVGHPCASSGPSVGIGWDYGESEEPVEWTRTEPRGDFRLTREDRLEIVFDLGYSARDIASVVRENLKVKNQRRRTINNLNANVMNVEKVELVMEQCNRRIRKLLGK